jgi:restriction endonuclease S subunit
MSEYVKVFLESPVGTQLVKTFQRGSTVMNINPADLGEMEIPLPDIEEQRKIVEEYRKEHQLYFETVRKAKERWEKKRQQIYDQLLD